MWEENYEEDPETGDWITTGGQWTHMGEIGPFTYNANLTSNTGTNPAETRYYTYRDSYGSMDIYIRLRDGGFYCPDNQGIYTSLKEAEAAGASMASILRYN